MCRSAQYAHSYESEKDLFSMHNKVAVLSLSAPSFKGILDVKQVLYRLCNVYLAVPSFGPLRIYLGLRWAFVPYLLLCWKFSIFDPNRVKETRISTKYGY